MKVVKVSLREAVYGQECASVTVITTLEDITIFSETFLDILSNTNIHGYNGITKNPDEVAEYVKNKLNYTDEQLMIVMPETIARYY